MPSAESIIPQQIHEDDMVDRVDNVYAAEAISHDLCYLFKVNAKCGISACNLA